MFMCTAKFDIESEQLTLIDEYLSTQEKQAESERKDAEKKKEEEFDSISDDEEDPSITEATHPSSERTLRKRRADTTSDNLIQLHDVDEIPLPDNSHLQEESGTQRRSSGRVLKRLRQDEDFVYN